jgi:hypothetical protein
MSNELINELVSKLTKLEVSMKRMEKMLTEIYNSPPYGPGCQKETNEKEPNQHQSVDNTVRSDS